jgi:hypothetical protein
MKQLNGIIGIAFGLLLLTTTAFADTNTWTVTFKIPAAVAHTNAFKSPCSSSVFFFVEADATKDGTQTVINVSNSDASVYCQDGTDPAMNITNSGNAAINVSANVTAALPANLTLKASKIAGGYIELCTNAEPPTTGCVSWNVTTYSTQRVLASNLAIGATQGIFWWTDMANYRSGAAGQDANTVQTEAKQFT